MESQLDGLASIPNRLNIESAATDATKDIFSNKQETLFQTVVKRAQAFEEFSKQISLELQTLYQEYLTQQIESELQSKLKKKKCKCKEQVEVQKQLIDSLKVRINKLETESITKNQEISKLSQDIDKFLELRTKEANINVK